MCFDIDRAVSRNDYFMKREQLGWVRYVDQISARLGFNNRTPGPAQFAERVAHWQRTVGLEEDGVIGPNTWSEMSRRWTLGDVRVARNTPTSPAPQCYANANPGDVPIDQSLLARSEQIGDAMRREGERFRSTDDLRWFFTLTHAEITRLLNQNISKFQRPNALLRLNIHFAEEFMSALSGQPHENWRRAFRACRALQDGAERTSVLVGEVEFCGAAMARVHIDIDLSAAVRDVGCIPPQDYGNVLVLVNRANLRSLTILRGQFLGAAEFIAQYFVGPMLDLEVKNWRNTVYEDACSAPVPNPSRDFSAVH